MQVVLRSLLATGLVALVASCTLNNNGLGASVGAVAGSQGAGGVGGMTTSTAGTAGTISSTGGAGSTTTGTAGSDAAAGSAGGMSGAAGDEGTAGAIDTGGVSGDDGGAAGAGGDDTTGTGGDSGTAGSDGGTAGSDGGTTGAGGAVMLVDPVGCADGTREGFVALATFPTIAACAGGWDEPGLLSPASLMPECDRNGGNEGNNPDGTGCSVADLCSDGWHVCETAKEVSVATGTVGCAPAYELYLAKPAFFVTRQRAAALICDPTNQTGTNNVYGCGNIGSAADKSCAPFMHMLRDSDCANHSPWACADGQNEYGVITKPSAASGGALCCKD